MDDDVPVPPGLPATLSLQELIWLTGHSKERLSQLAAQRVVIRTDRDTYTTASVRRILEHQREKNTGPTKWNAARSALATERARMAKLNREEREGELMRRDTVRGMACAIVAASRDRFLALASKLAHRLAVESKPANCERIVYAEVAEILEELAALEVVAERADGQRSKTRTARR